MKGEFWFLTIMQVGTFSSESYNTLACCCGFLAVILWQMGLIFFFPLSERGAPTQNLQNTGFLVFSTGASQIVDFRKE